MKKTIVCLTLNLLISPLALADTKCFLATQSGNVLTQEGNCVERHSPCATFNIAISLMGYNEGLLMDDPEGITEKLGLAKIQHYVKDFDYGNQDLSLTHAWLSSSLQISPQEQLDFLEKLLTDKLPVSKEAQNKTRNILFIENFQDGWKLYGKTGSGDFLWEDGTPNKNRQIGWFVGWLQKGDQKILFAHYIEVSDHDVTPAGKRAQDMAKDKLMKVIRDL